MALAAEAIRRSSSDVFWFSVFTFASYVLELLHFST